MFGNDKKKAIVPIEFVKKVEVSPLVFMNKDINGETNFAILKTTENGKWVRGDTLFYSLNGVEVYTDINNIIFVDTTNKTLFIREYQKVFSEILPEDPENKFYIVLYSDLGYQENQESNNEFPLRWEKIQGRRNVYDSIKVNASVIDIDNSLVLVDNVGFKDALSVRDFINYVKNADMVPDDDGFDINEYSGSEYI